MTEDATEWTQVLGGRSVWLVVLSEVSGVECWDSGAVDLERIDVMAMSWSTVDAQNRDT